MKKIYFFLAAMVLAITANAKVIQGTPNPGEHGRVNWWVNGEGQAEAGDTIVLADGEYEESSTFGLNKAGLVIMAAEGAKPVIKITNTWASLKLMATTTFEGITFDGNGITNYPILSSGTNAGSKFTFENCEFKNYLYYAISNPYDGGTIVDSIIINNCIFHDGGSAVYMNKKGLDGNHACKYFKMTNSTLYNITGQGRAAIDVSANGDATGMQNTVVIDHITLYNFTTSEYGGIAIRKTSDLQITNSIIANPTAGLTAIYHYCKVGKNLLYNVTLKASDGAAHDEATITTDPKFVDAANGNFALEEDSPAIGAGTDGSNLGDPRWPAQGTPTNVENNAIHAESTKVVRDGQIYIIRGNEVFNVLGQMVK